VISTTHTGKMGSLHKLTLVLLFCLVASGSAAEYAKYKDPKQPVSVRVKDLLSRMTLAEKIGQMTQIERENATADALAKYYIGMPDCTYTKHAR
jgi:beta-glucosidase